VIYVPARIYFFLFSKIIIRATLEGEFMLSQKERKREKERKKESRKVKHD